MLHMFITVKPLSCRGRTAPPGSVCTRSVCFWEQAWPVAVGIQRCSWEAETERLSRVPCVTAEHRLGAGSLGLWIFVHKIRAYLHEGCDLCVICVSVWCFLPQVFGLVVVGFVLYLCFLLFFFFLLFSF